MHFKFKHIIYILIFVILTTGVVQSQEIMGLNQIKPGMEGIGKTVFHGFKVETFKVKVIDILKDQGLNRDLILVKTGGEQIDQIGGIAAGMSGSPVYINGKLIGAIGYGWQFSDHHYALVTPIEQMLALFENTDEDKEVIFKNERLQTPLFVSGLTGRSFEKLKEELAPLGMRLLQGGGLTEVGENSFSLEPGSAIAVLLARGDVNVASIGTLTYMNDNRILAFGHPFYNKGEVSYLLSGAYINGIIPSSQQPFKLGSPTSKLIGTITEDRGSGIVGELNRYPKIIPLRINVVDKELARKNNVNVQLVRDESLLTPLATNIALQTIDSTLDRIGRGTARVKIKVMGHGLPELEVIRENIYYSQGDIAAISIADFNQLINLISSNPFKKINLIDIYLEIEVSKEDKVALVQEARVLNEKIYPGDSVEIEVTIHPYRDEPFTRTVNIKLPEDIEPGLTSLVIEGGYTSQSYQVTSEEGMDSGELNQAVIDGYKDFESIIKDFLERPRNNEMIIQVYPNYPVSVQETEEVEKKENSQKEEKEPDPEKDKVAEQNHEQPEIKEVVEFKYVLEGNLTLDINIEPQNGEDTEKKVNNGEKI